MTKNRRLTKASVYRYLQKRFQLALSQQAKAELGALQVGNPEVTNIALKTAYEETVNWATDQALYHQVRAIVKQIMDQYDIPTRLQGLFMAYGEKVLANFFVDKKGETLANLQWEYTRKLITAMRVTGGVYPMGYLVYGRHRVLVTEILSKIAVEVAKLVNIPSTAVGGYLRPGNLHTM